jgi:putative nucleotidyltransferase with HDIG domain
MSTPTPDLTQRLSAAVERMPAFPQSVQKILQLTRDPNCSARDLVQVIDKDPVVTVKVLRVVNSTYFALPRQITSIDHAVVYLGFNTIKNLALGIASIGILPAQNRAGFDGQQYLLHSLATAGVAKLLAPRMAGVDAADAFLAGLLHDLGKVVLALHMPDEFRVALERSAASQASLHLTLRDVLGADHALIGAMLVERWRFPPYLVEAIRYQVGAELQDSALGACVFAANQITKQLDYGFAGNRYVEPFPDAVQQCIGGTLEDALSVLGDLTSVYDEAVMFSTM